MPLKLGPYVGAPRKHACGTGTNEQQGHGPATTTKKSPEATNKSTDLSSAYFTCRWPARCVSENGCVLCLLLTCGLCLVGFFFCAFVHVYHSGMGAGDDVSLHQTGCSFVSTLPQSFFRFRIFKHWALSGTGPRLLLLVGVRVCIVFRCFCRRR